MASGPRGAVLSQMERLFQRGTASGASEWQLLRRYLARRDEGAFEAIVARHGPMVLGVCRRLLHDPRDVEDAFQATFLVLVRRARSLGERDAIGPWLYGVASRVALRARALAIRRGDRERLGIEVDLAAGEPNRVDLDLPDLLDEELGRLPVKYRAPVVLCYLEGQTHETAARQLGWPVGTVKGRLARARELLRGRLARRGLALSAGALAGSLSKGVNGAVPEALRDATVQLALRSVAGGATAGVISATVGTLAEGVLKTMATSKLAVAAVGVLATTGALVWASQNLENPPTKPGPAAASVQPDVFKKSRAAAKSRAPDRSPESDITRAQVLYDTLVGHDDSAVFGALDKPISGVLSVNAGLSQALKLLKSASKTPELPSGLAIYVDPAGLQEVDCDMDANVTLRVEDVPIKSALNLVLRPKRLAFYVKDGLVTISSREQITLAELEELRDEVKALREQMKGARLTNLKPPAAPAFEKGGSLRSPTAPRPTRSSRMTDDEEVERTQAIEAALNNVVTMRFDGVPLEEVVKTLKEVTKSTALPGGIPIYVDPACTAPPNHQFKFKIDLEGVRLKTTLRLLLNQLNLAYTVKEGLLMIVPSGSPELTSRRFQ